MNIESKLPNVGTTIFTVMSQLATEHNAVNLGQGFPDFNPDERLINLTTEAMKNGYNQYPPMAGIAPLRQAISKKIFDLYQHRYSTDTEITVTAGATEALMISIQALVKPGDEVIVIEPMYDLYVPAIELAGGRPVLVQMTVPKTPEESYRIDWNKVENALTEKTRLLILNTPHNPTGMTLNANDLNALENLLERYPFYVLSDEVYEHIVFENKPHLGMSSRPNLANRSVVVSSFGKTYHITGWKIGYCVAPLDLMKEIRKVHQFTVFTVTSPMQVALAKYADDKATFNGLASFYQEKRDYLEKGLASTKFVPYKSHSTFFLLANYKNLSSEPESTFAKKLTVENGVTVIPLSAFYMNPESKAANNHLVRFCFAKQRQTLDNALARLAVL
ncbi:methionine aminotransferase [Pusillimonas minor]|uniref:Aminotransferase class I/II-fold pyridoxal phosphate-dependent enzyme n=1 Tax=Pusillimonas minor TaxID=2697024 RepID=A0A842HQI7_9BURK|nr:methionine aminotransferase [Pusillimonas minor]MBC2769115.1 aminotransferase class I/II-fold pyridoxal phosphate-dependent enzyme [Pusillimonas minor]